MWSKREQQKYIVIHSCSFLWEDHWVFTLQFPKDKGLTFLNRIIQLPYLNTGCFVVLFLYQNSVFSILTVL